MRLLDLNILIYAMDESSPRHEAARNWLDDTLSGADTVALAWHVIVGFVRLSTRAVVFERPLTVDESFDVVDGWLARISASASSSQHCATIDMA
jgi:predicted nucleic acid-binding protein